MNTVLTAVLGVQAQLGRSLIARWGACCWQALPSCCCWTSCRSASAFITILYSLLSCRQMTVIAHLSLQQAARLCAQHLRPVLHTPGCTVPLSVHPSQLQCERLPYHQAQSPKTLSSHPQGYFHTSHNLCIVPASCRGLMRTATHPITARTPTPAAAMRTCRRRGRRCPIPSQAEEAPAASLLCSCRSASQESCVLLVHQLSSDHVDQLPMHRCSMFDWFGSASPFQLSRGQACSQQAAWDQNQEMACCVG